MPYELTGEFISENVLYGSRKSSSFIFFRNLLIKTPTCVRRKRKTWHVKETLNNSWLPKLLPIKSYRSDLLRNSLFTVAYGAQLYAISSSGENLEFRSLKRWIISLVFLKIQIKK